jgi:hypothetical protein
VPGFFLTVLLFDVVTFVETFYAARGIHHAAFAGEEWMAVAAYFNPEVLFSGTGGKFVAAGTRYLCIAKIFGMNFFFHSFKPFPLR